jgi:hypothetical protein
VLGGVGWCSDVLDAVAGHPLLCCIANVFAAVVQLEDVYATVGLVCSNEHLEVAQHLTLVAHEVHLSVSGAVINECDEVELS